MKVIGIILIIGGLAMLIFRGFNLKTEKKVLDVGPLEIKKEENKWFGWPVYTGAIAIVAGIVLVIVGSKKSQPG